MQDFVHQLYEHAKALEASRPISVSFSSTSRAARVQREHLGASLLECILDYYRIYSSIYMYYMYIYICIYIYVCMYVKIYHGVYLIWGLGSPAAM